ncbi:hypothetical protein SCHPADRAFT_994733 [Schizopora paradoxa]|uniref:F-box domain-containing protein n=1 Tax=Schizopora paradoxa TaxID=27342 RepID=A0A0H2SIN4_9AGAM|nr:hypothetical protein SCHPADRAFT_994733 [Schizopora paradoxa]
MHKQSVPVLQHFFNVNTIRKMKIDIRPMEMLENIVKDLGKFGMELTLTWEAFMESWPAEYSSQEITSLSGMKFPSNGEDDLGSLRSVLSCLRQTTMALKLVEQLVDRTATNVLTSLESLSQKLGSKINQFPDEIVSLIFMFAHKNAVEDDDDHSVHDRTRGPPICRQSLLLSHICRPWRTLACSIPKLWTTISSHQHPMSISHFVRLSRGQPLHVVFVARLAMFQDMPQSFDTFKKHDEFFLNVMPLSARWQSFFLFFSPYESFDEVDAIVPGLVHAFRGVRLDALEKLIVCLGGWLGGARDSSLASAIFSSCYIPKVRQCVIADFIPFNPVSEQISSLTVRFADVILGPVDSEDIFRFIGRHSNLSELSLLFSPPNYDTFTARKNATLQGGLDLPCLKKLRVEAPVSQTYDLIKNFLRSLSHSTLEEVTFDFRISLHEVEDDDDDTYLSVLFRQELDSCLRELSRHESLNSFTLCICQKAKANPYHSNNALDIIFSSLHRLKNLVISAPDFPSPIINKLRAPLRTLTLNGCSRFNDQFIKDLSCALQSQGALDSFERLSVDGCDELRKDVAMDLLSSDKVLWE